MVKERKEKLKKMQETAGEGEDPAQLKDLIRRVEKKQMRVQLLSFFQAAAT